MDLVFVLGTAGSGKSLLTSAFSTWLSMQGENVGTLNLDPGAVVLPYTPDVNVRDYIRVEDLMEEYRIGPNGALVLACDMVAESIDALAEELELIDPDLVIVDTPGQMELFAFRQAGREIAERMSGQGKAVLYLFDALFSREPLNYVANMFLSAAVYNR
ncbi:MAG: ATP/GTP-binding protein, partial [Candidatus Bathyarchaeia archaeon]